MNLLSHLPVIPVLEEGKCMIGRLKMVLGDKISNGMLGKAMQWEDGGHLHVGKLVE